ncbi:hypothetical protein MIR68_006671 [Amoeboaphelidium protococcarum]|nr:hypothetical protein MIR68_006671 [Amoeboaphelidium protococcarum]
MLSSSTKFARQSLAMGQSRSSIIFGGGRQQLIQSRFTQTVARPVNRPESPHLQIYEFQLPWLMSIGHRVTGCALSGLTYFAAIGYAASPAVFSSASMVGAVHFVPLLPLLMKVGLSAPFAYHSFNGIRHLLWDYGYCLALKQVYATGYAVGGLTVLSTAYLCSL